VAVSEHLVGRAAELALFDRLLDELDRGRVCALELVGEPGIGKTRLLAELAARADARRYLVLGGSASELEGDLPYRVFVDALDDYLASLPQGLEKLDADRVRLAQVFPSLSERAPQDAISPQERYRVHRSVRELLAVLATSKPLALVLDDLHWADPASTDLLGALLRQPPEAPVLIAMAARPRQIAEQLTAALERAMRTGALARVELEALTLAEAQELLGDVPAASISYLHDESGGNPFYLEQLARQRDRPAPGTHVPRRAPLDAREVPRSVADALSAELATLSENARVVLEGAAVAGDPFEPELAAAAAGTSSPDALEALDELLRLDVVRHTDVPRRFRFRHPLVRRAVYESTAGGWRLSAHERAAEALASQGASTEARAHHVERSARSGDVAAAALLRTAGEQAAHRAPASAARWLGAALELLPATTPAAERVALLLDRSSALLAVGRFDENYETLVEALDLVPEDEPALRVRVTVACAAAERILWRPADAHARLVRAVDALDDVRSPEALELMLELALDCRYRAEYDAMRSWSSDALDLAQALSDEMSTATAIALLAVADAFAGATQHAEARLDDAVALVDGMPDSALGRRLFTVSHVATTELYLGRYEESRAHSERAIAIAHATGQVAHIPYLAPALGAALIARGRLVEALEVLDDAIEATRLSHDLHGLAWNLFNRAAATLASGDLETSLETAREAVDLTRSMRHGVIGARAAVVWAGALLESGDPASAIEVLVDPSQDEDLAALPVGWRIMRLELLTRCHLAVGRADRAAASAAEAEKCATAFALPLGVALAQRASAAVALHAGDLEVAAELARASAAMTADLGAPIEASLSRLLAGRALARAGRSEAATVELERAAAELHACGAERYCAEAEQELRKLGSRIRRRTRPGVDGAGIEALTGRELEVARLVVDRNTNPQIAARLFLSTKTVETHLRNIFRKLGVANRVELARVVERADDAANGARR
jgi:ATP/maltotriose-dependent transcriptional regulator MalT